MSCLPIHAVIRNKAAFGMGKMINPYQERFSRGPISPQNVNLLSEHSYDSFKSCFLQSKTLLQS